MLKKLLCVLTTLFALSGFSSLAQAAQPHVLLTTSLGEIEIALNAEKAPISVQNFTQYVKKDFYRGTIFHRVIPGFMVQGGGFIASMDQKKPQAPIKNEANNGLLNKRGTIAMARTADVNSATSQFYINVVDNAFLDHNAENFGYAVFGEVVNGMDVVDKIAQVKTRTMGPYQDVPAEPVTILSAKLIE